MKWSDDNWRYYFVAENAFGVEVTGAGWAIGSTEEEATKMALADAKGECDVRSLKVKNITSIEREPRSTLRRAFECLTNL